MDRTCRGLAAEPRDADARVKLSLLKRMLLLVLLSEVRMADSAAAKPTNGTISAKRAERARLMVRMVTGVTANASGR